MEKSFFDNFSSKQSFTLGIVAAVLVLCTVGFVVMLGVFLGRQAPPSAVAGAKPNQPEAQLPEEQAPVNAKFDIVKSDHWQGTWNAPITMVEFSDFQCPFCSRFAPTITQLLKEYEGKIRFVYKHFPLDSLHAQARPAAIASECAAQQKADTFWKFYDSFFANQDKLGQPYFEQLAKENNLNITKFQSCLVDQKIAAKVEADFQEGSQKGVRGTPGTFINGQLVSGALPYEQFKGLVDALLKK
ncbi:MAG: DsbA family protein [bacterium]